MKLYCPRCAKSFKGRAAVAKLTFHFGGDESCDLYGPSKRFYEWLRHRDPVAEARRDAVMMAWARKVGAKERTYARR
jgi:hypothetical protein